VSEILFWYEYLLRIIFRCFALYISYCTSILSIHFRVARKSNLFGIFLVRSRWRVYNRSLIPFFLFLIVILHFEMRASIFFSFFLFFFNLKVCPASAVDAILFCFHLLHQENEMHLDWFLLRRDRKRRLEAVWSGLL